MTLKTRRQFLEDSMFAAATAGLLAGGARSVRAADEAKAPSANDIFNVAVVGVNGRGGSHIAGFGERKDCKIAAIVDVDEVVANRVAEGIEKKFGYKPTIYSDMRKCFEDPSIHIASIATPNHWHALAAIWAVQAGKDVYVEKPVSHNVTEGRRIVEAARKYGKIVQTGTQSRSNPGMREAIEFLQSGKLGEVKHARGLCYRPRAAIGAPGNYDVPASVNFDMWCGPAKLDTLTRPKFHYDWHWQWAFGNGDLGNQGIHQMDIARWGLGEHDLGESVLSYGGRFGYVDAGETANTQVCIHQFQSGKRLTFEVRGLKTEALRGASVGVIFTGTEGYLVCPSYTGGMAFSVDGMELKKFQNGGDDHHYANFIAAVRSRKPEELNAEIVDGHLSSALCHVGNISYRLGQPVSAQQLTDQFHSDTEASETLDRFLSHLKDHQLDPATTKITLGPQLTLAGTEVFSGARADEANPMLTRDYRAPYVVPKTEDL
jgi:predicted dehydrogenase